MTHRDHDFTDFATAVTPRLLRTAKFLCVGDRHWAEDLVQTTLARLYASWSRVRKSEDPDRYAQRTLLNRFRTESRLLRNSERPLQAPDLEAYLPYPEQANIDLRIDLIQALRELNTVDRAILVMRYWAGFSVRDVADILRMSEVAVRTRCSRAVRRIREQALLVETGGDDFS